MLELTPELLGPSSTTNQGIIGEATGLNPFQTETDERGAAWLRERGLDWAADLIPDLALSQTTSERLPLTEQESLS